MKLLKRLTVIFVGVVALGLIVVSLLVSDRPEKLLGAAQLDQAATFTRNPKLDLAGPVLDLADGIRSARVPARTVVLTFDDGPSPEWTPAIQQVLDRQNVPGTFFVIGEDAARHPDILRSLDKAGHEIGNHSYTHAKLGALDAGDVVRQASLTQHAVASAIGKLPVVFRPPYSGATAVFPDEELAAATKVSQSLGLLTVMSDYAPRDFDESESVDDLVAQSLPPLGEGAVITFHDGGGNRARTVEAVERLISVLKANGYQFVRASDVVGLPAGQPAPAADRATGWFLVNSHRALSAVSTLAWGAGLLLVVLTIGRVVMLLAFAKRERDEERNSMPLPPYLEPVTVIVPAHNEETCIEGTIRSILNTDHPDVEVIVVDDGSTDRTVEIVRSLNLPNVQVVEQPNAGKFFALNMGLVRARNDIVIMVDADTVFERTTIPELIQPFRDPTVGAVAGNAKVGNRNTILGRVQHIEYTISSAVERRMFNRLRTMSCVPGAVGAFRRRAIVDVGGMSHETLAEDTDITMALTRAGWQVPFTPEARAWTESPTTIRQLYRQRLRWAYGILQALVKHRDAIFEGDAGGRLGRRVILYQLIMGYLFALIAPVIDVLMVYQLVFGSNRVPALIMWGVVNAALLVLAAYALHLEREKLSVLWAMPFQQILFRQVLYAASLRAIMVALLGSRLPWHSLPREGAVAQSWANASSLGQTRQARPDAGTPVGAGARGMTDGLS